MHEHPPLCSITLTDASWRMTLPSGEVTEEEPGSLGDVECEPETSVHIPENSGDSFSEVVMVAMTDGASAGTPAASEYPDAVTADPDHYTVEFENDVVRLVRVSYGAGEQSVMHFHPAYCYVSLSDGTWHMTNTEGEVEELATPVGTVACIDAGPHQPTNAAAETGRAVLIEFKGREAVQ
jgi:quercetin dioxygenase-like cupin family protein